MRRLQLLLTLSLAVALTAVPNSRLTAQTPQLRPVTVGSPMPDITLPVYQGGDVTLSDLRGKRVMMVFPRGLSRPTSWCHVCPYQLAELADYEATTNFRERANLEILFVIPYRREKVGEWIDAFPQLLQDIEDSKNPSDAAALDDAGRARLQRSRLTYPETFRMEPEDVERSFPILIDADHAVSSGLGLFTTDWSGSDAEQNIPTILIIDEEGILQFKYMSQNTRDRPPLEYLVWFLDVLSSLSP
ncbi:redoxin domain-containing protein [Gemmatimonadota bacterium]